MRIIPEILLPHYRRHGRDFAIGFLLLAAANGSAAAVPYLMKLAADALSTTSPTGVPVWVYALGLILVAILNGWFRMQSRVHIFQIGRKIEYELRDLYYAKLQMLDADFFDHEKTGDLVSRGTNDITAVRMFIGPGFLQLSNTAMVYVTILPIMITMDPILALTALAPMPVALFAARWLSQRLYRLSRHVADRFGHLSGFVQEAISGIAVIRSYAQETNWQQRFSQEGEEFYAATLSHARLQGAFGPLMLLSGGIGTWIILLLSEERIARGELTVGDFVAFTGYLALLIWPTVGFGWILAVLQRGLAALARMQRIIDIQQSVTIAPPPPTDATAVVGWSGGITIQHLSFAYANQPILHDISLEIPAGHFVGIVGRIGSGKSTLLGCLAALRTITPDTIFYDGCSLQTIDEAELRRNITMVPQESFLFSKTMLDNILYSVPHAGETVAWQAAREACLDEEIARFPHGMQTMVGERGITLSGGQRQRVALARTLVTDARILLLDDIFSHVDAATEQRILQNLRAVTQNRTVIMVCHRLASLSLADFICVLDHGNLIDVGTHYQLLESSNLYQDLHHQMVRLAALEALQ